MRFVSILRYMLWGSKEDADLMREASEMLSQQRELLMAASVQLAQWQKQTLETTRQALELAMAYRISFEKPEVDIRDELDSIVEALSDSVGLLEEHLPIT